MKKQIFNLLSALVVTFTALIWLANMVTAWTLKPESLMNIAIKVLVALLWVIYAVLCWLRWHHERE